MYSEALRLVVLDDQIYKIYVNQTPLVIYRLVHSMNTLFVLVATVAKKLTDFVARVNHKASPHHSVNS